MFCEKQIKLIDKFLVFNCWFWILFIGNIDDGSPEASEGMMEPVSAAARRGVCVWVREWGGEREGCV